MRLAAGPQSQLQKSGYRSLSGPSGLRPPMQITSRPSGPASKRLTPSSGDSSAVRANRHWIGTSGGLTSRSALKFFLVQLGIAVSVEARLSAAQHGSRLTLAFAAAA